MLITSARRVLSLLVLVSAVCAGQPASVSGPVWNADDELLMPEDYRSWIYLSSGFDMTYGPARELNAGVPLFTNVFVLPAAHEVFVETGHWPEGTMFALEIRSPSAEPSGEVHGRFQKEFAALEVSVKNSDRFDEGWGFYDFSRRQASSAMFPYEASCYACHKQNAAVDYTFVQFYPTLIDIAVEKGVYTETGFHD